MSRTRNVPFDWDVHVSKDIDMGYTLMFHMTSSQRQSLSSVSSKHSDTFLTEISLPFEGRSRKSLQGMWLFKTKWDHKNKIYHQNAIKMAEQYNVFMDFVEEAIKRNYSYNDFDPVTFMHDMLEPIKQIRANTIVRWNEFWGIITRKISPHTHVYPWNIQNTMIYNIQLINTSQSIRHRKIIITDNYLNITADPSALSVYTGLEPADIVWKMIDYVMTEQTVKLQQAEATWNENVDEVHNEIVETIRKHLKHSNVNHLIAERRCNMRMNNVVFNKYLAPKCNDYNLYWEQIGTCFKLRLKLLELQQIFGDTAGEREHIIKVNKNESKWLYFLGIIDMRYSYNCRRLFMSFTVKGKDPQGDVIATYVG
eukprot:793175_1